MSDKSMQALAAGIGLEPRWTDADGIEREVSIEGLRSLTTALGYACGSGPQIAESCQQLARASSNLLPTLITALRDQATVLETGIAADARFRIELESGGVIEGRLADHAELPAIGEIGYHRLTVGDSTATLAVAPARCFSMDDLPASDVRR